LTVSDFSGIITGMAETRLRLRVGSNEFEAEGSREFVESQVEAWKHLFSGTARQNEPAERESPQDGSEERDPSDVFSVDEERSMVSLTTQPTGDQREADAALLILYGFRALAEQETVLVGRVKDALEESGFRPGRIDRILAPHVKSGLVLKSGQGKGSKYRLSNTGLSSARGLAQSLAAQLPA